MTAIWLLCICRLQVNSRCAVKQKETFALMISCAASFCPLRFVAAHVCMLRWPRPLDLAFWGQSDTSDMFCLFSAHILVPAKVALCSLRTGLYRVWMHAAISTVLAIQWTSRALSALNTCNYSHYPQSPPALPFLPLPLSVFLLTFSSGSHRGKGGGKTNKNEGEGGCKRWRCVVDDQETGK